MQTLALGAFQAMLFGQRHAASQPLWGPACQMLPLLKDPLTQFQSGGQLLSSHIASFPGWVGYKSMLQSLARVHGVFPCQALLRRGSQNMVWLKSSGDETCRGLKRFLHMGMKHQAHLSQVPGR